MALPDELVIDYLVSQGVITAKGTDGFVGPAWLQSTSIPEQAVFALHYAEGAITDYLAPAPALRAPRVQLTIRSGKHDFAGGQDLTYNVWKVLHQGAPSGTISCRVISGPFLVEQNPQEGFVWTCNVELQMVPA